MNTSSGRSSAMFWLLTMPTTYQLSYTVAAALQEPTDKLRRLDVTIVDLESGEVTRDLKHDFFSQFNRVYQ